MRSTLIFSLVMLFFIPVGINAEEEKDFANINLESLLEIETVTAAQKSQKVSQAPAVISVLTSKDIENLGVQTLYEALEYLSGVVVTESYFGYTMVNIRGVLQYNYNNKVLFLVNGHPVYEVVNGSFHLETIPLRAVERVEVIRGPGSALYGTNAYAGVINVITRKKGNEVYAGVGSFGTFEGGFTFGKETEDSGYLISMSTRNDDGYPFNVEADEKSQSGTFDYENDVTNLYASCRMKEFTLSVAYFNQEKQKFGIVPVLDYRGISEYSGGFLDALWKHPVGDRLSLSARLRYDAMEREMDVGHFPADGWDGHENADTVLLPEGDLLAGEFQLNYQASEAFSILTGIIYEHLSSEPYYFKFKDDMTVSTMSAYLKSQTTNDFSLFGQMYYQPTEKWSMVLGFRASDNSDTGSALAPRAGVVYSVNSRTSLKLLYGEAFRHPNFFEKYVATYNVLYGTENLNAEKIRNIDLVLDHTFQKHNVRLDVFYLETDDLITRIPGSDPANQGANATNYINGKGDTIWGTEVEVHGTLSANITYFLNFAFLEGENTETEQTIEYIPEYSGSIGFSWNAVSFLLVHPNVKYVASQGDSDGYTLFNLTLNMPISDHLSLFLTGRNLSDEDYTYPEYVRGTLPYMPGGPERAVYGKLILKF